MPFQPGFRKPDDDGDFPVIETTATTALATTSSYAVTLPSGIAAGNLVIAMVGTGDDRTFTWPGSWVELIDVTNGTSNGLSVAYLIAAGGETSVTATLSSSSQCQGLAVRISGHNAAVNPPETATPATGSSTTPDPPNLAPSWGSAKTLWIALATIRQNGGFTGDPTNYGSGIEVTLSAGNCDIRATFRSLEAASDNPSNYTHADNTTWIGATIAVQGA